VDDCLAVIVAMVMVIFVHPEDLGAELGADFAADTAIRIYSWCAWHGMDTPDWICEDNLNKPFIFLPVVLSVCLKHIEYVYLLTQKRKEVKS
jgi:hypothetical protein